MRRESTGVQVFSRKDGRLWAEGVEVAAIADRVGTPCYIYSRAALRQGVRAWVDGLKGTPGLVCYSVKANGNLAVLRTVAAEGAGFDVVSGGELARVQAAGGDQSKVVFSGVGKQPWEIRKALEAKILQFNVESAAELDLIAAIASQLGVRAPVALRVNPDVDPRTHPYIATGLRSSKFGIAMESCMAEYRRAMEMDGLEVVGVDCHIGSQLTSTAPLLEAVARVLDLVDRLGAEGIAVDNLDVGGGLGIVYNDEEPPAADQWARALVEAVGERDLKLIVEPGRSIAGNAGILVTRVLRAKANHDKNFIVVDAAMNDLARPSLYDAYHAIEPVAEGTAGTVEADIVGPVCETGDFLARGRRVAAVEPGGLLAVMSAGAYGSVMASNYNARPRPPEVLVDGGRFAVVRRRETVEDMLAGEQIPAWLKG